MLNLSLAAAVVWRRTASGTHPLFKARLSPVGGRDLKEAKELVAGFGLEPSPYSMSFDEMAVLAVLLSAEPPARVVEFGCGTSTEFLLALREARGYPKQVISFEQSEEYFESLRARLHQRGLDTRGLELVHAPVVQCPVQGQPLRFYDPAVIAETLGPHRQHLDLFLVDGPSGGGQSRFLGALVGATFGSRGARVVLHDALRDWELSCALAWESLGVTRGSRVYPVGRGILAANLLLSKGELDRGIAEDLRKAVLLQGAGEARVRLREVVRASVEVVSARGGKKKATPVTVRSFSDLDVSVVHSEPDQPFTIPPPQNLGELPLEQQERLLMRDASAELAGGKMVRLGAAVLTERAQILVKNSVVAENMEGEYEWQGIKSGPEGLTVDLDLTTELHTAPAVLLEKHGVRNYALWWLEILPRMFFAFHRAEGVPRRVILRETTALEGEPLRFREETLRLLGGDALEIVYARCDAVVLDGWLASVNHYARSKTRWNQYTVPLQSFMQEACRARVEQSRFWTAGHEKLFVLREDSGARRLANLEALGPELERRGFFLVNPGELHWIDQMALFAKAKTVAGVHGAGLVNLLWSEPGTKVVEAFPPSTLNRNTFRHIAVQRGLPYWVYVEAEERVVNVPGGSDSSRLDIDMERFVALLDRVG